jgi:hypothetical protein
MRPSTTPASPDPDDWAPCQGHPPWATAGPVGCSDDWPPPNDGDRRPTEYVLDTLERGS